jgi:flagellar protein FlbD
MIRLTHLNGDAFIVNAELIRYIESLHDTYVTLVSGDRLIVRETMDEVVQRAIEYQRSKYLIPPPQRTGQPAALQAESRQPGIAAPTNSATATSDTK